MKSAWRLLEAEYPWITPTCCGPHTLSLELKDMAKLPEVAAIIAKVQKVLSLFWGRKRMPRRKLREVILQHTGKQFAASTKTRHKICGQMLQNISNSLRGFVLAECGCHGGV